MIYVVSGLPRSGTSMMMKMLSEGGLPVLADANEEDEQHPGGSFQHEPVKHLHQDTSWLKDGDCVKVVSMWLPYLPKDKTYRVLWMKRDAREVAASQVKLAESRGHKVSDRPEEREREAELVLKWLSQQPNFETLVVDYNGLMSDPASSIESIGEFLGATLDNKKMLQVPNEKHYRNRA